jgi:predicted benzoate:H+ symporter BenE
MPKSIGVGFLVTFKNQGFIYTFKLNHIHISQNTKSKERVHRRLKVGLACSILYLAFSFFSYFRTINFMNKMPTDMLPIWSIFFSLLNIPSSYFLALFYDFNGILPVDALEVGLNGLIIIHIVGAFLYFVFGYIIQTFFERVK